MHCRHNHTENAPYVIWHLMRIQRRLPFVSRLGYDDRRNASSFLGFFCGIVA